MTTKTNPEAALDRKIATMGTETLKKMILDHLNGPRMSASEILVRVKALDVVEARVGGEAFDKFLDEMEAAE